MKVTASIKALCDQCKIISRKGIKRCVCSKKRSHNRRQGTRPKVKEKGA